MTDRRTVFTVALALALVVVGAVAGSIFLAAINATEPPLIGDLAKVALGALGALLASTRSSDDPPQPVNVVNEANDPVPVAARPLRAEAKKAPARRR